MKKVVSKFEVAHLWANQLQDEARTPTGNMYFKSYDPEFIYSYGSHFVIARRVQNNKGEKAILFSDREYSVSTSKHKNIVRSAISHLKVIRVYNAG